LEYGKLKIGLYGYSLKSKSELASIQKTYNLLKPHFEVTVYSPNCLHKYTQLVEGISIKAPTSLNQIASDIDVLQVVGGSLDYESLINIHNKFRCKIVLDIATRYLSTPHNRNEFYGDLVLLYESASLGNHPNSILSPLMLEKPSNNVSHFSTSNQVLATVLPFEWESGLEFAIDAVGMLRRNGFNIQFWLIGSGPYQDAIIYGARLWNMWPEGIRVINPSTYSDLQQALSSAHLLLHTPFKPNFSLPFLNTMLRGVPIVTSYLPDSTDNLKSRITITDPRNPQQIASNMQLILTDSDYYHFVSSTIQDIADQYQKELEQTYISTLIS
jgi:glycosyltransferase involved in cell wall biosynthesis